jgi:tRNA(adenine34) deaminase
VNYELFMSEAIAEARRGAAEGENAVGAVAVLDDAMIARGRDRVVADNDPTAHAVLLTIQAAARRLESRRMGEMTIFSTHEPCAMCVGALVEAGVGSLVYGLADELRGGAGSVVDLARVPGLPHQVAVISGVREAEVRRLGIALAVPDTLPETVLE